MTNNTNTLGTTNNGPSTTNNIGTTNNWHSTTNNANTLITTNNWYSMTNNGHSTTNIIKSNCFIINSVSRFLFL